MSKIDRVHVVFKTHLDIGFTDLAENVTEKYINHFIPSAIKVAEDLDNEEGPEQFLWTTGSWLIYESLKTTDKEQKKKIEEAIRKGYIAWHGLPFTTHTELMDSELFEFGLSLSEKLDKRFGKKTISAKMTDVPGHSKAIIPYMCKHGIKYLHLGVNPASKNPKLPNIFLWKGKDGSELIVNYAANYGEILEVEGLNDALVFAHTGDNCGPSSPDQIKEEFVKIKERFPDAEIKASTLDEFAEKLLEVKENLPVIYEEIGDSWIHGVATDPKKVSGYRELLRLRSKWIKNGKMTTKSQEYENFSMNLALIAEHTWGLDLKKYLTDYKNYSAEDFKKAREDDILSKDAIPDKYSYIGAFAMDEFDALSEQLFTGAWDERTYSFFESSWKEQREYINKAIDSLNEDKKKEVAIAFEQLKPELIQFNEGEDLKIRNTYKLGNFNVEFNSEGAISKLADENGKEWADEDHVLGLFTYESFGQENYNHWFENYMENLAQTHKWSESDFSKPGMEYADPKPAHELYKPILSTIKLIRNEKYDCVRLQMDMLKYPVELLGSPKKIEIEYKFYKDDEKLDVNLCWFDKNACRLPEATWLSFIPKVDNPNVWKMDKMGELISPLEVVKDGNRNLHAVDKGVYYNGADGKVVMETLDAPLVSPGERRVLRFDNTFVPLDGGMHFNLNNNIWGTNFPMWYEDDAKFRFSLIFKSY